MRRLLLIALGAMVMLPLVTIDPAIALLLFDLEFVAVIGGAGILFLRGDARLLWLWFADCPTMLATRVAFRMTRERPSSILDAG